MANENEIQITWNNSMVDDNEMTGTLSLPFSAELAERLEPHSYTIIVNTTKKTYTFNNREYESLTELIQRGILGFCSCGQPWNSLKFLLEAFDLAFRPLPDFIVEDRVQLHQWCDQKDQDLRLHFGSSGAVYFFYYWCDKEGFSEHGGGVYSSWLTDKGDSLVALLRYWKTEFDKKGDDPP